MQYSFIKACLLAIAATSAYAQTANFDPITKPVRDEVVPAGAPYTIKWTPSILTDDDKISLILLQGTSNLTLTPGPTVASGIANGAGSYSWDVPTTLGKFATFGLLLQSDANHTIFQYSNPFSISGLTTEPTIVTATLSQVYAPPTTSSSSSTSTSVHHNTSSTFTTTYHNTSTTAVPATTTKPVVVTTTPATTTAPIASVTPNAASGIVAGSGVGVLAIAMALFL